MLFLRVCVMFGYGPSLRVLRAGTMVERFTARMHVFTLRASHVNKNQQIQSLTRISMPCGAAVAIYKITLLVKTVFRLPSSNNLFGGDRRRNAYVNRIFGHVRDVFVNCARSAR